MLFVASKVKSGELEGCIGIQLCNEAEWGAKGMYEWYADVMKAVQEVDPSIPLYVSDAWDLDCALDSVMFNPLLRHSYNPITLLPHPGIATQHQTRLETNPKLTSHLI